MEFYQKHPLWGYTRITTTDDGLLVDRKRLTSYLRVEIPYEELLPVQGKTQRSIPLFLTFFTAFGVIGNWVEEINKPLEKQADSAIMGVVGLAAILLCYFTYTRWQNAFTLKTGKLDVLMAAQPSDEAAMQEFVEELRAHTKAYLYQRYALLEFPPLKQRMKRWLWLYEQKVVSLEEFNTQFPNRRQQ